MKEYALENGKKTSWTPLASGRIPDALFRELHARSVITCHDVFIRYKGGFLLVRRDNTPAKGELFPVGGRLLKGVPVLESLRRKAKAECNLAISDVVFLGVARTVFRTDPFGHGKGTDTLNLAYAARGSGALQLDGLHDAAVIVRKADFTPAFRKRLHPYVRDSLEQAFGADLSAKR